MLHVLHCQCGGISAGYLTEPTYDRFTACAPYPTRTFCLQYKPLMITAAAKLCDTIAIIIAKMDMARRIR